VTVASDSFQGRSFHSRFGKRRLRIAHPASEPDRFLSDLQAAAADGAFDVLLPTTDRTTLILARHHEAFAGLAAIPVPAPEATELCKDKWRIMKEATAAGLDVPQTRRVSRPDELSIIARDIDYPAILKPRKGAGGVGASIVNSADELIAAYHRYPAAQDEVFDFSQPLVQRFIRGSVHEVCALFNRGEPRALLTQRRLLKYPHCGAGIYNETTDEPDLKALATDLLRRLEWHGPAQVEFLREEGSGRPYLLEVNGRFWGTIDLAVAAGLDFPVLACRMARDGDVPFQSGYRVGLRYRWPFPYALLHARESGRWWGSVRDFLLPGREKRSDISFTDPMPLVMEVLYTAKRVWGQRFSSLDTVQDWEAVSGTQKKQS